MSIAAFIHTSRIKVINGSQETFMKTLNSLTSACRYCRYYTPEGRRGGMCQLLGAQVHGGWNACQLAIPAFAPSWENLEQMMSLPDAQPLVLGSQPVTCGLNQTSMQPSKQQINSPDVALV